MNAASDKEYIDAKLETTDTRVEGKISVLAATVDAKFPELRADMQKGFADLIKWMVGTVIAVNAVSVTVLMFAINNAAPKAAASPAPIIIYMQPPATPQVSAPAPATSK